MSSVVNNDLDDIFKKIAKAIYTDLDIDNLGKALGFEDGDIGRTIDANAKQGGNIMGTVGMLRTWRKRQTPSTEKAALRSALLAAGFDNLAVLYLSTSITEPLVPQPSLVESGKPATVFLSYQRDHQPEVKAIKKHLEMAGFPCWMDIGQMGGGDQLFAKIDQGIRSSKVVLCMVTEKYSKSKNCNKEVNLAHLLKKPIIPVLIDNTRWPPEGAMSVIFAELLYIRFFNKKQHVRGEQFWEDAKFSELVDQISCHATPHEVSDEQHPRPTSAASAEKGASSKCQERPSKREITTKEIVKLSKLLPDGKYTELCGILGFNYNYIKKIKKKNFMDSTAAFEELLHEWKDNGGSIENLDAALKEAELGGLVSEYKN